jgi:large subunit ribosomal protein L1
VGKFSFAPEALVDNGKTVIEAVVKARPASAKGAFVENVTLSATMSPGLKIDASSFIKI